MIVDIQKSPNQNKRFRVIMDSGKHYDFGLLGGSTYIDHGDEKKRDAYRARHLANAREATLNQNLTPSPSLFSMALLWGSSTSINENIKTLNARWKKKHGK